MITQNTDLQETTKYSSVHKNINENSFISKGLQHEKNFGL